MLNQLGSQFRDAPRRIWRIFRFAMSGFPEGPHIKGGHAMCGNNCILCSWGSRQLKCDGACIALRKLSYHDVFTKMFVNCNFQFHEHQNTYWQQYNSEEKTEASRLNTCPESLNIVCQAFSFVDVLKYEDTLSFHHLCNDYSNAVLRQLMTTCPCDLSPTFPYY